MNSGNKPKPRQFLEIYNKYLIKNKIVIKLDTHTNHRKTKSLKKYIGGEVWELGREGKYQVAKR